MASFTAGTTFVDGVANDVTAAKLGALVNNATPTSGLIQDRTAETVVATNDTFLIGDASDSNTLKRMTVANVMKAELTGTINTTAGTITTLNSTTGTIPTITSITKITSGTGTAAAPAISPTGDTNTGIFFPAADTIAFSEGGTEGMRIDSSGDVGIGTTSVTSGYKLDARGWIRAEHPSGDAIMAVVAGNTTGVSALYFGDSASDSPGSIEYNHTSNSLFIETNGAERLRIDSDGDVGIGETNPAVKLHVQDTAEIIRSETTSTIGNNYLSFYKSGGTRQGYIGYGNSNNDNLTIGNEANASLAFLTNATNVMLIDSSGNVGIGDTTPTNKLQLADNKNISVGDYAHFGSLYSSAAALIGYNAKADTTSDVSQQVVVANSVASLGYGFIRVGIASKAGAISFHTTSGTVTAGDVITNSNERMRIDESGNVGIGDSSPAAKLDVNGSFNATSGTIPTLVATTLITTGTGTAAAPAIVPTGDTNTGVFFPAADTIAFSEGGTEAMRLNSSGNVSIGTATALSKLHVHGDLTMSNATTATSASTGGVTIPATVAGYLSVTINGTSRRIPYFAA